MAANKCSPEERKEFIPKTGPIVGSMLTIAGWLIFILFYAINWSRGFDLYQNVIVSIVSLGVAMLITCGVLLAYYRPNGELRSLN